MARITEVHIDTSDKRGARKGEPKKVLTVAARTAVMLRKVAKADGIQMTAFLDRCLRSYLKEHHPEWEVEEG